MYTSRPFSFWVKKVEVNKKHICGLHASLLNIQAVLHINKTVLHINNIHDRILLLTINIIVKQTQYKGRLATFPFWIAQLILWRK